MKKAKNSFLTVALCILVGNALLVGCSSKESTESEPLVSSGEIAPSDSSTVAQNTNLGASSSGYGR